MQNWNGQSHTLCVGVCVCAPFSMYCLYPNRRQRRTRYLDWVRVFSIVFNSIHVQILHARRLICARTYARTRTHTRYRYHTSRAVRECYCLWPCVCERARHTPTIINQLQNIKRFCDTQHTHTHTGRRRRRHSEMELRSGGWNAYVRVPNYPVLLRHLMHDVRASCGMCT